MRGRIEPLTFPMILRKHNFLPIAHRGGNTDFAENTIEAFERAKELGYRCIEIDVQLSRDGVVYVYHDTNCKRLLHLDKIFRDLIEEIVIF